MKGKKPIFSSFHDYVWIAFCGMCMGISDIVPGISGGTMALIIGVYENLISSIRSLNFQAFSLIWKGQFRLFFEVTGVSFLLTLLGGIALAFLFLAPLFDFLLSHETYRCYLYSAFFGLILASSIFCTKLIKNWRWGYFLCIAIGFSITYFCSNLTTYFTYEPLFDVPYTARPVENTYVNYSPTENRLLNVSQSEVARMLNKQFIAKELFIYSHKQQTWGTAEQFSIRSYQGGLQLYPMICGSIAICAMLLPGISGSYLLSVLGVYPLAISALADITRGFFSFRLEMEPFYYLLSILIGISVGALLFSHVVNWLLKNAFNWTLSSLIGFMLGAIEVVWPFWSYGYKFSPFEKKAELIPLSPYIPQIFDTQVCLAFGLFITAFATVFFLEWLANKREIAVEVKA